MAGRRQSRLTKSGSTARAFIFATTPSGSTMNKNTIQLKGVTANATFVGNAKGLVNFGDGLKRIYSGVTPLGTNKTTLSTSDNSGGTVHIATGLTTITGFFASFRFASGVTPGDPNLVQAYGWMPSGKTGGVSLHMISLRHGLGLFRSTTNNAVLAAGGASIYWTAIGT